MGFNSGFKGLRSERFRDFVEDHQFLRKYAAAFPRRKTPTSSLKRAGFADCLWKYQEGKRSSGCLSLGVKFHEPEETFRVFPYCFVEYVSPVK